MTVCQTVLKSINISYTLDTLQDFDAMLAGDDAVMKLLVDAISIRGTASVSRLQSLSVDKLSPDELQKLFRGVREKLMDLENTCEED